MKTPATSFVQLTNNINYFIQHKNYQKLISLGGYAQNLANDLQNIVSNLLYWSMSQQGLLSKKFEQDYSTVKTIVRIYNTTDTCFKDVTISIGIKTCCSSPICVE